MPAPCHLQDPPPRPRQVVVIGGTGFVGRHLIAALAAGPPDEVTLVARRPSESPAPAPTGCRCRPLDVENDPDGLATLVPPGAGVVQLVDLGRGAVSAGSGHTVAIARRLGGRR